MARLVSEALSGLREHLNLANILLLITKLDLKTQFSFMLGPASLCCSLAPVTYSMKSF